MPNSGKPEFGRPSLPLVRIKLTVGQPRHGVSNHVARRMSPERFLPQSRNDCCRNRHVCWRLRRGTCVAVGRCATGNVGCTWGNVLVQWGVRAIPLGIAAMVLGFVLKSAGTQAGPTDPALPAPRISVFGTIHPELFQLSAPLGSGAPGERIRLASIEPQVGLFDTPAYRAPVLTDAAASACANAPFEERFAAVEDHPASFDKRFASTDDCPASFDRSLAAAMQVLASSLRLPPDQGVEKKQAAAPVKPTVAKANLSLSPPPRKEAPPLEDDGRTAI